jgi:hypothetical protein
MNKLNDVIMVENKTRRKAHKSISLFSFYVPRVATKLVPFTLEQVMEYVFVLNIYLILAFM